MARAWIQCNLIPMVTQGGIIYAPIGDVILSTGHFHANARSRGVMDPDRVTLGVHFSAKAYLSQRGIEALPGDIFSFAPGGEEDGKQTGHICFATVSFTPEILLKMGVKDAIIGDRLFGNIGCVSGRTQVSVRHL